MNRLVFFIIYQLNFLVWCFVIHDYFFEFTAADKVGLTITAIVPLAFIKLNLASFRKIAIALLLLIPVAAFPVINYLRMSFSESWLLIYFFIFLTGAGCFAAPSKAFFFTLLPSLCVWVIPYPFQKNQYRYYDRLLKTIETRKGVVDIVQWKGDQWIYYNESVAISTSDGHMHTETLAHTVIPLFKEPKVLLCGGDHGYISNEIEKYGIEYDHVPYDIEMAKSSLRSRTSKMINEPIIRFLFNTVEKYDVIILDLPDPENIEYQQYYTTGFYQIVFDKLTQHGVMITNSGSAHSNQKLNIKAALNELDWEVIGLQAEIPTLGHRYWMIAGNIPSEFPNIEIPVETKWINKDAIKMMLSTGKYPYPF